MGDLMTPVAVAKRFKVKKQTVLEWARSGRIPSFKIARSIRFDGTQIEEALRKYQRGVVMRG